MSEIGGSSRIRTTRSRGDIRQLRPSHVQPHPSPSPRSPLVLRLAGCPFRPRVDRAAAAVIGKVSVSQPRRPFFTLHLHLQHLTQMELLLEAGGVYFASRAQSGSIPLSTIRTKNTAHLRSTTHIIHLVHPAQITFNVLQKALNHLHNPSHSHLQVISNRNPLRCPLRYGLLASRDPDF